MKFKSGIITQASGSLGGATFFQSRGGLTMRARTVPINPSSVFQNIVRAHMASLVVRWNDTLTELNRISWRNYATNVPLTGPLGDPITVTGLNMYIRTNVSRLQNGRTILDTAPAIFNLGTLSPVTVGNATVAAQTIDMTFDAADGWNVAAGYLALYVSRPQNAAINYFKGPFRLAGLADGGLPAVSPVTLSVPFPILVGQKLFTRAVAVYADGRMTEEQFPAPITTVA